jgi:transcriptional regulator with XRE-family HTH domain
MDAITPGALVRDVRRRHRVTQKGLAIRAGTTQSSISRIERDHVSPTVETLRELLFLMGEDLVLGTCERHAGVDRDAIRANLALSTTERIERGEARAAEFLAAQKRAQA